MTQYYVCLPRPIPPDAAWPATKNDYPHDASLPNTVGNFRAVSWFSGQAYADVMGLTLAAAQTVLDAAVTRGACNTGSW